MTAKEFVINSVEAHRAEVWDVADRIWEYAEISYEEYQSAALLCEILEKEGFHIQKKLANMETCFSASYGSGKPVIGLLGEFDALPELSQKRGALTMDPVCPHGAGHGCGHHALGAGCLAAALAIKDLSLIHIFPDYKYRRPQRHCRRIPNPARY